MFSLWIHPKTVMTNQSWPVGSLGHVIPEECYSYITYNIYNTYIKKQCELQLTNRGNCTVLSFHCFTLQMPTTICSASFQAHLCLWHQPRDFVGTTCAKNQTQHCPKYNGPGSQCPEPGKEKRVYTSLKWPVSARMIPSLGVILWH